MDYDEWYVGDAVCTGDGCVSYSVVYFVEC